MNFILFQLVVLHAALTSGFGGRHGFGGGSGGAGGPPADLFSTCAVSYFQTLMKNFILIISRTPAFKNSTHRTKSGKTCDIKDTQCICKDQQVQNGVNCCVSNTCSSDDQAKARKFIQGQCEPFGVTDAGVCQGKAAAPVTVSEAPVTISEPAPDPVTVPVPVPGEFTPILFCFYLRASSSGKFHTNSVFSDCISDIDIDPSHDVNLDESITRSCHICPNGVRCRRCGCYLHIPQFCNIT
jgi:hypothetical protein